MAFQCWRIGWHVSSQFSLPEWSCSVNHWTAPWMVVKVPWFQKFMVLVYIDPKFPIGIMEHYFKKFMVLVYIDPKFPTGILEHYLKNRAIVCLPCRDMWLSKHWADQRMDPVISDRLDPHCCFWVRSCGPINRREAETVEQGFGQSLGPSLPCDLALNIP